MNEETKRRIDVLLELSETAWNNFHTRRIYEWKLNFSLWTILGAFIGIVLTGKLTASFTLIVYGTALVGVLVMAAHFWWLWGVMRGNRIDREIALHYQRIIQDLSESRFSDELERLLAPVREGWGNVWKNWSVPVELGITFLLVVVSVVAVAAT